MNVRQIIVCVAVMCVLCDAAVGTKKPKKSKKNQVKRVKPQADAPLPVRKATDDYIDENYDQTYYDERDYNEPDEERISNPGRCFPNRVCLKVKFLTDTGNYYRSHS